jgi:pectate lyase
MKLLINIITISLLFSFASSAQTPAFPGAEGFGAYATGGRGGEVYHVTNLSDSGAGSFRDAVGRPGRTVVFDVGGVIKIRNKIQVSPNITIAGQTAPGEGIVVYGNGVSFSGNTIVRYMRFRGSINMPRGACVVVADDLKDIIFDHVSVEWGRWDNLHIKNSSNVTMQYCLIGEAIDPQRFGALFEGPVNVTIHHCLWIDNQSRNPKAKAGIEYINNVVYNWGSNGLVGGHSAADHFQDIINNYFIAGPNSSKGFIGMFSATDHVYHAGNYSDLNKDGVLNGRLVADTDFLQEKATLVPQKQNNPSIPVKTETAEDAFKKVMKTAGASLHRDAVDARIIGYLQSIGKEGKIFKTEADAGGQGAIAGGTAPKDSDGDGIPDAWEKEKGLNPAKASDGNGHKLSKVYTNLEVYINSLIH